jgi:uncharacterized protein DUF2851
MAAQSGGFSDLYARLVAELADLTGEQPGQYGAAGRSVREEIVRCIWFGGHIPRAGLTTDDGRRIELLSPGWWNVEGGPDFIRAEFLLEGCGRVVGDVEVHTLSSAWKGHGHHRQTTYNSVSLHVTMWSDSDSDIVRQDGDTVPQITLSRVVDRDLEELVELMDSEDTGSPPPALPGRYCGDALRDGSIEPDWLARLLDAAGDHRILSRADALVEKLESQAPEQVLYERIAEALGFKNNRMPFLQLTGLLPIAPLRLAVPHDVNVARRAFMLEAAMFSVSGSLDDLPDELDDETAAYVDDLRNAASELGDHLPKARLSPKHWRFGGTRPVNYPTRRIAALAQLYAVHLHDGLLQAVARAVLAARPRPRQRLDVAVRNAVLELFTQLEHPYWSRRYTFGGKRLAEPKALIGAQRATSLLVDVLLPMLLAQARTDGDTALLTRLHTLWRKLPRRQENTVTRRMSQVMFDDARQARRIVSGTCRQQGLHQLYRDACRAEGGCRHCVLYLAHSAGRALSR